MQSLLNYKFSTGVTSVVCRKYRVFLHKLLTGKQGMEKDRKFSVEFNILFLKQMTNMRPFQNGRHSCQKTIFYV